jgi:hypothetical protein
VKEVAFLEKTCSVSLVEVIMEEAVFSTSLEVVVDERDNVER